MKLRILGSSGGIGGGLRTTSMLLDNDVLIDAGTGVADLSVEELGQIDHIFVSHSHLDHIACIPLLIDTVASSRATPVTVYAISETLDLLRQHIFNWSIWPDFTQIPDSSRPVLRYQAISIGKTVTLGGREITPLPANHVVPAVGFQLNSGKASLVYSGDTSSSDEFWEAVNKIENLRYLIIETSFTNREAPTAIVSRHFYPDLLARELIKLKRPAEIYITHLKPGEIELIMHEVMTAAAAFEPRRLGRSHIFEF